MKAVDLSPLTAALDAREWSIIQDYADPAIADGLEAIVRPRGIRMRKSNACYASTSMTTGLSGGCYYPPPGTCSSNDRRRARE